MIGLSTIADHRDAACFDFMRIGGITKTSVKGLWGLQTKRKQSDGQIHFDLKQEHKPTKII